MRSVSRRWKSLLAALVHNNPARSSYSYTFRYSCGAGAPAAFAAGNSAAAAAALCAERALPLLLAGNCYNRQNQLSRHHHRRNSPLGAPPAPAFSFGGATSSYSASSSSSLSSSSLSGKQQHTNDDQLHQRGLLHRSLPTSCFFRSALRPPSRLFSTSRNEEQQQDQDHHQTPEEQRMTRDCLEICEAAIKAVDPYEAVRRRVVPVAAAGDSSSKLRFGGGGGGAAATVAAATDGGIVCDLAAFDEVVLVAFGKASSAMACAVLEILLALPSSSSLPLPTISGAVIAKDGHASDDEVRLLESHGIPVMEASHPVPDRRNVEASERLLEAVSNSSSSSNNKALVICCISGGGSALFCAPHPRLTLEDLQATNEALLGSGWRIQDMNVVRKRLERGKGGRLAAAAAAAVSAVSGGGGIGGGGGGGVQFVSLILSDVLGDALDLIASGPTAPDTSTWQDAWELVQQLPEGSLPESVVKLLRDGKDGLVEDSPSADNPVFQRCYNCLVGNNALAVTSAAKRAEELGYHPVILGTQIEGEASEVARVLVGMAQHLRQGPAQKYAMSSRFPVALIAGGETTVSLPSGCEGKGGRNQELALSAALGLNDLGLRQVVIASIGTDGNDGPTDAAGAIVDGRTVDRLPGGSALEALKTHDAYPYLIQEDESGLSPLIRRGPTGTNVADVMVALVHGRQPQ